MEKFGKDIQIDGEAYGDAIAARHAKNWMLYNRHGLQAVPTAPVYNLPGVRGPTQAQIEAERRHKLAEATHKEQAEAEVKRIRARNTRAFEQGVVRMLALVRSRRSGAAVLSALGRKPWVTTIVPFISVTKDWNNGVARAEDLNAVTKYRRLVRNNKGELFHPLRTGTGAGSNVTVEYITPDLASALGGGAVPKKFEQVNPDKIANPAEVLIHELVHALRMEKGVLNNRAVPNQPDYHGFEEFFAMLVANIFRSEEGRSGVRKDNHAEMERIDITDRDFFEKERNRRHLRQFRRDHRTLFSELKAIEDVAWNPLRHSLLN